MRSLFPLILIIFTACSNNDDKAITEVRTNEVSAPAKDVKNAADPIKTEPKADSLPLSKVYSNERFKNVTVKKTGNNEYLISGKGQIFEASFSWVVEDGHNELKKGYSMTNAGAPEWGNFRFTVNVKKERENSTLHLILFESSAKDGSRQYELPILLN